MSCEQIFRLIMSFDQMSCVQICRVFKYVVKKGRDQICSDQTSREETPCGQIS